MFDLTKIAFKCPCRCDDHHVPIVKLIFMIESQVFLNIVSYHACFLMSCLSESLLSEIPEKGSESFSSDVVFPKLFRSKVFDFNAFENQCLLRLDW